MPPPRSKLFPTPDDAETAFYEAFERGDLAAMMAVWAETDDVVCIHPQGPRLVGIDAVRQSWTQIFASGAQFRIVASGVQRHESPGVAVHAVIEVLSPTGDPADNASVCATNVYELTENGWRMVLHHATALPTQATAAAAQVSSHVLH